MEILENVRHIKLEVVGLRADCETMRFKWILMVRNAILKSRKYEYLRRKRKL